VLPFNDVQEHPEEAILTHEQIMAQLEERGLPVDLVPAAAPVLQAATSSRPQPPR
jgi:hypothetical protein